MFPSPVVDLQSIEAIKALVRDQQLRVAAGEIPAARPDRGFHKRTIGTGAGELRIGEVPEQLLAYLPFRPGDVVNADVRFSYGSERSKPDDGKGMLGLSLRLYFPDNQVWNLTQLSAPVFLKNADEVRLTMQAAKVAAEIRPASDVRRSLAVVRYILRQAPWGRKWAMLKFGWNATFQKHDSVATTTFYNPTSYALDHPTNGRSFAVRFELRPMTLEVPASRSAVLNREHSLAEELCNRYTQGPVTYAFGARFFADERQTPVDDPSSPWSTPFVKLGMLVVVPARDGDQSRIAAQSYNPGHVAPRVRFLSTINQVRNVVYETSMQLRIP